MTEVAYCYATSTPDRSIGESGCFLLYFGSDPIGRIINGVSLTDERIPYTEQIVEGLLKLIAFVGQIERFDGSTGFCESLGRFCSEKINPGSLKRLMNRYRYDLENTDNCFLSAREKKTRRPAISCIPRTDGVKLSPDDEEVEDALRNG